MKLSIVVVTRGRPEICRHTVRQMAENCRRDDTTILVAMDSDDAASVLAAEAFSDDERVRISIHPREDTRGLKYDRVLRYAPAEIYLVGVDHTPILTPGFDQIICDAGALIPDGIGCVCTPMANASFPYLQAPTARMVEIMGYVQAPYFPYWFIDHWLDDIARMIGRYVMVDVSVNSDAHPGKTIGMHDVAFWANFYTALEPERRRVADRLIDAMDEPEWRKKMLRSTYPLVEARSRYVNSLVISDAAGLEAHRSDRSPVDERYRRVKSIAEAAMAAKE